MDAKAAVAASVARDVAAKESVDLVVARAAAPASVAQDATVKASVDHELASIGCDVTQDAPHHCHQCGRHAIIVASPQCCSATL